MIGRRRRRDAGARASAVRLTGGARASARGEERERALREAGKRGRLSAGGGGNGAGCWAGELGREKGEREWAGRFWPKAE